jgi:hypothetical protein
VKLLLASAGSKPDLDRTKNIGDVFLRLAALPTFPLDRLSRYEYMLWRQARQLVCTLESLRCRKRQPSRSSFPFSFRASGSRKFPSGPSPDCLVGGGCLASEQEEWHWQRPIIIARLIARQRPIVWIIWSQRYRSGTRYGARPGIGVARSADCGSRWGIRCCSRRGTLRT